MAKRILGESFNNAKKRDLDSIAWLFRGNRDLWGVAIESIEDTEWFDFFYSQKLWSDEEASHVIAIWVSQEFTSTERFKLAIEWLKRLGETFSKQIALRLMQERELTDFWVKAWRLLSISKTRRDMDQNETIRALEIERVLGSGTVLNSDLEQAVKVLAPVLELWPRDNNIFEEIAPQLPERIEHLAWPRLHVLDEYGASRVLNALVQYPSPCTILALASAQLETVARLSVDIGFIEEGVDNLSRSVPSIELHPQNESRDGAVYLVQLIASVLPSSVEKDCLVTRRVAESWTDMPGRMGIRLWLHSLRDPILFTSNEAINELLKLSMNDFWTLRRELALVLRERADGADAELLCHVEHRILTEGQKYYDSLQVVEGLPDWRDHAHDTAVWLRLNMLDAAGTISELGTSKLKEIKNRRDYLDRKVEDQDYFDSYLGKVRTVVGDAQPIIEATDEERLDIAREAIHSPDIEKQHNWFAYCQSDPFGAFDVLHDECLDDDNVQLWTYFINALSMVNDDGSSPRDELVVKVFERLCQADEGFLAHIINPLSNLYYRFSRQILREFPEYWTRLFDIAVNHDDTEIEPDRDLLEEAVNSPCGRLTQAMLIDISKLSESGETIDQELLDAIMHAAMAEGRQGAMSRAILIESIGFVESINGVQVSKALNTALGDGGLEAVALRSVMVAHARLSQTAYHKYSKHILRGVSEVDVQRRAYKAAAKIMIPALSIRGMKSNEEDWKLTLEEISRALREGPPSLREGAAHCLNQWIAKYDGDPVDAWRTFIQPCLENVWPRERKLLDDKQSPHFALLAINAGEAFPEAFEWLYPYLCATSNSQVSFAVMESEIPEKFSADTLSLLWKLFGTRSGVYVYDIHVILDRIINAKPELEVDRRLQWLYRHCY